MKKLTKSSNDKMISGVLGGVAEYLNVDSTFVRVAYVLLAIVGSGSPILLYILLAIIIPDAE